MRIGWIGFHMEGLLSLQGLLEQGTRIEAVITLKPSLAAKKSGGGDYLSLCKNFHVPLFEVENINDQQSIKLLKELSLDLAFVIGWTQIIREEALKLVNVGMIGAHASLLPHNRGSAPINWALINGEKQTGNSLIWLAEGVDSGDIIDQTPFPITPYDTCASLYQLVAVSNRDMILRVLPKLIAGERPGHPQSRIDEPILPRRRPNDGRIDWTKESCAVYDFVRALTRPYPGAFSWLDGKRWIIWKCALVPVGGFSDKKPGEVLGPLQSPNEEVCGQVVACGKGVLLLLELEGESSEILRGRQLSEKLWQGSVWLNEHE